MDEPRDTDPISPRYPSAYRRTQPEECGGGSDHFAAQLGASRSGCLRFTNGAHRIAIRADLHLRGLYRAHRRLGANSGDTRRYRDHPVLSGCVPRLDGKEVVRCLQEIHGWTMQ